MWRTRSAVVVGLLVAIASLVGAGSAATRGGVFVRCSFTMTDHDFYHPQGVFRGGPRSAKCSSPLGIGRYDGRYKDRFVAFPVATETGSSKLTFRGGVVRGIYRVSGSFTEAYETDGLRGAMQVKGGTGQFAHAHGTLRLKCGRRLPDEHCDAAGTLTGI